YATFEGNSTTCIDVAGGTLYLDHSTFLTTTHQYVALDSASFLLSWDYFPTSTAGFELLHGTGGIKSGGRGIVRDCFFGNTSGNNDIMDYTGGNRDLGQPIVQYYNNVFSGGSDDILDLDGTDAWIEGNIFMHDHQGPVHNNLGTSSAVSGGSNGSDTSQITIIGNIFYDCDNVAMAKQGNFFTLINNTVVHQSHAGSSDTDGAVIALADEGVAEGAGMYLEGNIVYDAEKLVRNWTNATVTWSNNLIPFNWTGAGGGNSTNDPLLKYVPQLSETAFTTWEQAQVMRDWLSLAAGSPGIGTGPNGRDKGGVGKIGASISGDPYGTNNQTSATLNVGIVRSGFGMPVAGWPNGSGYTHYKYRLDSGAWSAETVSTTPIALSGLANGQHLVEVTGKRDSAYYQDDPAFDTDALVTTSRTWTVDTTLTRPTVRLNEILAQNGTTLTNNGNTPDLIELYNYGTSTVDLTGMGLTDNGGIPYKYTFPATTSLGAGQYLVLFADSKSGGGIHLGFSIKAGGDDVYLTDKAANGGALLDSVVFGLQLTDYSIGRLPDGSWTLCKPTLGSQNLRSPLSDPHNLKINEWLADEAFTGNNDFIEVFNPGPNPVALGGLFLSNAEGAPGLNQVPALTFMPGNGYQVFTADNDTSQGADHVNFKLDADGGIILLFDTALNPIDVITYGPQRTDVSQGRSPSGSNTLVFFSQPTAGAPNPAPNGVLTVTNITSRTLTLLTPTTAWRWDNSGGTNQLPTWNTNGFNDSAWSNGIPLFGSESTPNEYLPFTFPAASFIPAPNVAGGHITVYFRSHFQWTNGVLTNFTLYSTNYIDDGVAYYLNGVNVGSLRMPATYTYNTLCVQQLAEGVAELLTFPTNSLVNGDNVLAAELHQNSAGSSDDVFGMFLSAVQLSTNVVTTVVGVPVVLNEVLASNHSLTNAAGQTPDWIELFNTSSNLVNLADVS
ncbi:MAG TPA: lamin tail domain-containing protein, partial [Candidatus Dormibacteraeota bacterium]|nr:lamin tail domain-containing protein [Candidatus Dormibacteraeota bacterium]